MANNLFTFLLFLLAGQFLHAQTIDGKIYSHLVKADSAEFVNYAKSVGLATDYDTTSESLFAKAKGLLYTKPLSDKSNNEYYDLVLIVSTLNKDNNKIILGDAKEIPNKKGFWTDDQYLYREWDLANPISNEMWFKVLVYKRKK